MRIPVSRAVVVLAVVLALSGGSVALGADDDGALLRAYAPVLRVDLPATPCAAGNGHLPIAVEAVVGDRDVSLITPGAPRRRGPTAAQLAEAPPGSALDLPGTPRRNGCTERRWEADLRRGGLRRVAYARVVRDPDAPQFLFAQYWFFMVTNDWEAVHEGDWEMVQLEFATSSAGTALEIGPVQATFSQHAMAETVPWTDVDRQARTHPLVGMAVGSNATEPRAGVFLRTGDGCDVTSAADDTVTPDLVVLPSDAAKADAAAPWLRFPGTWGRSLADGPSAPVGPAFHEQWSSPWHWSRMASRASVRIPWRGPIAARAADAFCAAVASVARTWRDLGRLSDPWRMSIGGGLALLVVLAAGWAARTIRKRRATPVVVAAVGAVTVGLGVVAGAVQWTGDVLAVGPFVAVSDTVVVIAAVLIPLVTLVVLTAAAITASRPDVGITDGVATALRHPLGTWRQSQPHARAGAVIAILLVGLLGLAVSRVAAVALLVWLGWPSWTMLPVASVIDVLVVGGALLAIAAGRSRAADRRAAAT